MGCVCVRVRGGGGGRRGVGGKGKDEQPPPTNLAHRSQTRGVGGAERRISGEGTGIHLHPLFFKIIVTKFLEWVDVETTFVEEHRDLHILVRFLQSVRFQG